MSNINNKIVYAVSFVFLALLFLKAGSSALIALFVLILPLYILVAFTAPYKSAKKLKRYTVHGLRRVAALFLLFFLASQYTALKDCKMSPAVCDNVRGINLLLSAAVITFVVALLLDNGLVKKHLGWNNDDSDNEDPVITRFQSMTAEVIEQYRAPETSSLIAQLAGVKANQILADMESRKMKSKVDETLTETIHREVYTTVQEGYNLWLAHTLHSSGSLRPAYPPEQAVYNKEWQDRPNSMLMQQVAGVRQLISNVHKNKLRVRQMKKINPDESVFRQLWNNDVTLLTLGFNVAEHENAYRNQQASERRAQHQEEQAKDIVDLVASRGSRDSHALELLKTLHDEGLPIYAAGSFGFDLLTEKKASAPDEILFIAYDMDAAKVVVQLKGLGFKVTTYSNPVIDFEDDASIKSMVYFYSKGSGEHTYTMEKSDYELHGELGTEVESGDIKINVASPLFYIQMEQTEILDMEKQGDSKGLFDKRTSIEVLRQLYFSDADPDDGRFMPILKNK